MQFEEEEGDLVIHNRVLLKVNGKPISVLDVARKMDLLFYRQYPDLRSSSTARYQFYMSAWKQILQNVIDDQLILADAVEKQVTVSDGEVREEMEHLFGPDVVHTVDSLGMNMDEAFELVKTDLTVQRMIMGMVRSKAIAEVYPKSIRKRYEQMLEKNPPQDLWVYQVLSIRGEEHEKVADKAHALIAQETIPFEEIISHLQGERIELNLSEEYRRNEEEIALSHKAVLETLSAGLASAPVSQEKVSRIFCLKGHLLGEAPPLREVEVRLKGELTQEAMERVNGEYREKLREQYGVTTAYLNSLLPENFRPFVLR
ncbi:MAG: hypothetical protein K940chlam9_01615 [Chlamydiae bacterium]|nr:hypothetical protein [Chlamydiota bacterium]